MAVYKKTYRPYEGALTPRWSRLLVIPRYAFEDLHRRRFLSIFFVCSFIYPLICAIIIYVQHNASALSLINAQGAQQLITINVVFFFSLLGWQSMLALFLAAFVGPGQVSPDLANNALALYLARPFSRAEYVLGKMSVLLILLSLMTWVPGLLLFGLESYLEGWSWVIDHARIAERPLLRLLGMDSAAGAAGAGAVRLGEMEARRRRADVRRVFRSFGFRRGDQRRGAHQLGPHVQHRLSGGLGVGAVVRRQPAHHQRRGLLPLAARRRRCRCGCCWAALAVLALVCLYMLARKIRGAEVVR